MRRLLAGLAVGLLALTGCTSTAASGDGPIGDRPLRVTTTTNFITDTEIPAINATFTDRYGQGNEPKFTEILVNKRIDDRFFLDTQYNPEPGTMIY